MTETTTPVKTRAELEAELASLAAEEAPSVELSTRDRSPAKPSDRTPSAAGGVTFDHAGVTITASRSSLETLRTLDLLEQGMINSALRRIITDEKYEEFLDKNPDAGIDEARALFEAIADKVGAKNS